MGPDPARRPPIELDRDERGVQAAVVLPDGRVAVIAGGWPRVWKLFGPTLFPSTVACAAEDLVVAAGSEGTADLVVLHQGRIAWSGWSIP